MASICESCGYRNSELKPGERIPEKGKTMTLCVKNIKDLSSDVIKRVVPLWAIEMTLAKYVVSTNMTREELDKHTLTIIESGSTARVERKSITAAGGSDAPPGTRIIIIERVPGESVPIKRSKAEEKIIATVAIMVVVFFMGFVFISSILAHARKL